MNIGLTVAFVVIILSGVIYGRIEGYAGSILRFADIFRLLAKMIRRIRERLSTLF